MNAAEPIELAPELATAVASAAAFRGMSPAEYVRAVVVVAAQLDAELAAGLKRAEDDFAAGRVYSQEEVEARFGVRREQRDAA